MRTPHASPRGGMTDPSKEDRRRYQALRLGKSDGETLLTELLPYPSPGVNDWLYARFGRYGTRETYTAEMLPLSPKLDPERPGRGASRTGGRYREDALVAL